MARLIGSLVLAFALAAVSMTARAEQSGGTAKPKRIDIAGTVSAVAHDSLTVKNKQDTWTFTIDKTTAVTVKGATKKNLELKAEGKAPSLPDFVHVGDQVTVGYHDMGATKHAAEIKVTASLKK